MQRKRSHFLHRVAFLLLVSVRPLSLFQIGQEDELVKAARLLLLLVPFAEATLFAFRSFTPLRAAFFVGATALIRFTIGCGVRLSMLLTFQPETTGSYTPATLIEAGRTASSEALVPVIALITTVLLETGLGFTHAPRFATETCVLFLVLSELVSYVLREKTSLLISSVSSFLALTIYSFPLIFLRFS